MARPKRTRRQQVYGERKKKRLSRRPTVAELARKEKVIAPTEPSPIKGVDFKKLPKVRIPTVKPRRVETAAQRREILIVSRKGQPQIFTQIEPLEKKNYPPESISSSWLSTYGYFYIEKIGTFTTKTGRQYKIFDFDFDTWEQWYYAHSKGTFFNEFIKEQYTIRGTL